MKKLIILTAAVCSMTLACKNVPVEERLAEYTAKAEAIETAYSEQAQAIQDDATLTDDQKAEKFQAAYDATIEEYIAVAKDAIKKNRDNEVAVAALKNIINMVEIDEAEAMIATLKAPASEDEFVISFLQKLENKKATAEGKMFTDFTIVQDENDPEGSTVKFSDYVGKGKYVLVDFWASWCGPCKREIPNIAAVYEKYKGESFDVLSIAVWDKPEDTKASAVEHGVVWNQIINAQRIPTDIYGIEGIPHIMLVGPDGTIVKRDLRGAEIEKAVAEALGR